MAGTVIELPPRGHYLAREAGWLAGVSGQAIGQWARRGLIRSSQSEELPRVYSFQDVAEALLVHELVEREVPLREIRNAIDHLRQETGSSWPLTAVQRVAVTTPGVPMGRKRPVAWLMVQQAGRYVRPARSMDEGMFEMDLTQVVADLRHGGWAVRDLPDLEHVEVDTDRLSGRPVVRGTRLAVEEVANIASEPDGRRQLLDDYGLSPDEVRDALRWREQVRDYESIVYRRDRLTRAAS